MRLPDDVMNYIFEYHNPLKEYYSNYILVELKIRNYQDYIKNRYGVDVFEKTQDDKANILAIKTIDNINEFIEEIKEIYKNKKWFYDSVILNIRRKIISEFYHYVIEHIREQRKCEFYDYVIEHIREQIKCEIYDEFIIAIIMQIVLTQKRKRARDILTECIN